MGSQPEDIVLLAIHDHPGKTALALIEEGHLQKNLARHLSPLERGKMIVYKGDGWHLTGKGDARLATEVAR